MSLKFRVATRDFGQANCHSISASFARAIFHWPEAITLRVMGVSDHLHLMIWSVSKNFLNFVKTNWFFITLSPAINPFSTNVPLLYPLKTSENLRYRKGYRSGTLVKNGLIVTWTR